MNKKIYSTLILTVATIVLVFFTSGCINTKLPTQQPVKPDDTAKININDLPIIDDCRERTNKKDFKDEIPNDQAIEKIAKKLSILKSFNIRDGHTIGRIRREVHGLPSGYWCSSLFDVGIINAKTNRLISGENIKQAFIFKEEDLPNIGWWLYGDTTGISIFKTKYEEVKKMPICSNTKTFCNKFEPKEFPSVNDGQITTDNEGRKVLHRFNFGKFDDFGLYYHKLSITKDGYLTISSENIYEVITGIMI